MLKNIWNWLKGVEQSFEDHLRPLTKIIADLEKHAEDFLHRSETYIAQAKEFEQRSVDAAYEAAMADKHVAKLKAWFE